VSNWSQSAEMGNQDSRNTRYRRRSDHSSPGRSARSIRNGDTLAVSKLDRLGRDAQDPGGTMKALVVRNLAVVVLPLGKLNIVSAAGKLMWAMPATVSHMERNLLIERMQSGLATAA
jgi:DNA invertase Pin-like site-specific DNA recombinase